MDVLKEKSIKQYDTLSRYSSFNTYYNTLDDKYLYGLTSPFDTSTIFVLHDVKQYDTLESLALKYYGRPDYFWIIAMYNNINDAFCDISKRKSIKIPTISNIKFIESRR